MIVNFLILYFIHKIIIALAKKQQKSPKNLFLINSQVANKTTFLHNITILKKKRRGNRGDGKLRIDHNCNMWGI